MKTLRTGYLQSTGSVSPWGRIPGDGAGPSLLSATAGHNGRRKLPCTITLTRNTYNETRVSCSNYFLTTTRKYKHNMKLTSLLHLMPHLKHRALLKAPHVTADFNQFGRPFVKKIIL
jgi:hypothetical protein